MNCARKLDWYSFSFCSVKVSIDAWLWPNTFTRACPVKFSSMWPLSLPVVDRCLTNCGCAFFPIHITIRMEAGTGTQRATSSGQEIHKNAGETPLVLYRYPLVLVGRCCR